MYFTFVIAFPRDHVQVPVCLTGIQAKSLTLSVVTFEKFIAMQMTPSFIYRLTQAVLDQSSARGEGREGKAVDNLGQSYA